MVGHAELFFFFFFFINLQPLHQSPTGIPYKYPDTAKQCALREREREKQGEREKEREIERGRMRGRGRDGKDI